MQDVLNSLLQAHQQAKNLAIAALQDDQELEQTILDTIKSIYACIQAVRAASGL